MKRIVGSFINKHDRGLKLINMPTGIGKTFQTNLIINEFLNGNNFNNKIKRIFYITPLVKNVDDTYNDLKVTPGYKNEFDKLILRLKSFKDTIKENYVIACSKQIPNEIRDTVEFRRLNNLLTRNNDASFISEELDEVEPKFRSIIYKYVKSRFKDKKQKERALLNDKEFEWLRILYPSILIPIKKVIYTTIDKFINYNEYFYKTKTILMNDEVVENSLIFIDEFDSTKARILNNLIDDAIKNKINLISLFNSVVASFNGRNVQNEIYTNQKNVELLKRRKDNMLQVSKDLHLNSSFKLIQNEKNKDLILFDDFINISLSNTKNNLRISYKYNKDENRNDIFLREDDKSESDDINFYNAVTRIHKSFDYFINIESAIAKDYLNKKRNSEDPNAKNFWITDAVSTVLDPFQQGGKNDLDRIVMSHINSPKKIKIDYFDSDFFSSGFMYYRFIDDDSHDTSTEISSCLLYSTPEKVLLSICSRARVIGLSATASIDSTISNYNIDYLKNELKNDFDEYSEYDSNIIRELIKIRTPKNYDINIIPISETNSYMDLFKNINNDYFEKRFNKRMQAISRFLENPRSKVMLLLCNENEKDDPFAPFNKTKIEKRINEYIDIFSLKKEDVDVKYLTGNKFEKNKQEFLSIVNFKKKIILISSYASVGTGQNLMYNNTDISSLYIEYPTNVIVNLANKGDPLPDKQLLESIYQTESLLWNNEISTSLARQSIRKAVELNAGYYSKGVTNLYNTKSVKKAIIKTLIQGIGRICRTNNKENDEVNIYFDEEIKKIDFTVIDKKIPLNKEFVHLMKFVDSKDKQNKHRDDSELIKAENNNIQFSRHISNLLSENKYSWNELTMKQWKKYREICLLYPTIDNFKIEELLKKYGYGSIKKMYLYSKNKFNEYYSSVSEEDEFNEVSIDYIKTSKCISAINEKTTRLWYLMQLKKVRDYFIRMNYATTFDKNDGMLLPVIIQNIYKGALGEVAGKVLLEDILNIKIAEIDDPLKYEKFDFKLKDFPNVYIDFKNWSENFKQKSEDRVKKCLEKLECINGEKIYLINLTNDKCKIKQYYGGKVVAISALCLINNEKCKEISAKEKIDIRRAFDDYYK